MKDLSVIIKRVKEDERAKALDEIGNYFQSMAQEIKQQQKLADAVYRDGLTTLPYRRKPHVENPLIKDSVKAFKKAQAARLAARDKLRKLLK